MKLHLMLGAAACAALLIAPTSPFSRELLTDDEMAEARGGVLMAGSVAFEFGAVVKAYEDGALALETQVNWTPQGVQMQRTAGAGVSAVTNAVNLAQAQAATAAANAQAAAQAGLQAAQQAVSSAVNPTSAGNTAANVTQAANGAVQTALNLANTSGQGGPTATGAPVSPVQVTDTVNTTSQLQPTAQTATVTPGSITVQSPVTGLPQGVFTTASGATLLQQVTQGQLLNVLMNTQDNHSFLLTTDITLVLPGFSSFQTSVAQQVNGLRIGDEIHQALMAGGH